MNRRIWLYVTLAILFVALGAFGTVLLYRPATKTADSTAKSTPTPTSIITPTPQVTATPKVTATPAGILTVAPCPTSQLQAAVATAPGGAAAGSMYWQISLTNTGSSSCSLNGYPGVSLVNGSGQQIGQPADRDTTKTAGTITVAPQHQAVATLRQVQNNYEPGVCQAGATQLKIYPPNQTAWLTIPTSIDTWCPGFSITPMATP